MYFDILSGLMPIYALGVLAIALALFVGNRRKVAKGPGAWSRVILLGIVLCWALAVLLITVVPFSFGSTPGIPDRSIDLVPFNGFTDSGSGVGGATLKEAVANALLFAGGAPFIAVHFARGPVFTALFAGAFAVGVEALQYIIGQGRASTVGDVIWAIAGGLLGGLPGGLVGKTWRILRGREKDEALASQTTPY